ncbi:MAG: PAS domain S-box protein [Desulfobacterales bacterium]
MSFRTARNVGLGILLLIIVAIGLVPSLIVHNLSESNDTISSELSALLNRMEAKDRIEASREQFDDFVKGTSRDVAPIIDNMDRVILLAGDFTLHGTGRARQEEGADIRIFIASAKRFRAAVKTYAKEALYDPSSDNALQLEIIAIDAKIDAYKTMSHIIEKDTISHIENAQTVLTQVLRTGQRLSLFGLVLGVMAGLIASFYMARSLNRPVRQLVDGTKRIARGDLSFRVNATSKDEIGQLAAAFDEMSDNLQTAYANLQDEIAAHKLDGDALRNSEEKYRTILENIEDGYFEVDLKGNFTFFNNALCNHYGYPRQELMGMNYREYTDDENARKLLDIFNSTFVAGQRRAPIEFQIRAKDGEKRVLETPVSLMRDENGDTIGFRGLARDLTERRNLESQLLRAQKMEAIGTLAGGVAHDLNNILSGIVSYPEVLLLDIPLDSPLRSPLLTIQKSGEKAATIVQDLLTLARRGVAVEEIVNLNTIVSDYVMGPENQRLQSFHPKVQFEIHLDRQPPNILGSPVHLSKIVMNLVSNAAEAMPEGGTITLSTANQYLDRPVRGYDDVEKGKYVVLSVKDTGIGISPEDQLKIFEPFHTRKVMGRSGTGLGMAVVWGTIQDHNGYIDIESTVGKGTEFLLYFPVTEETIEEDESLVSIDAYKSDGESILVVDDVKEQRDIATVMLTKLGYSVVSASSGEEAVEYMNGHSVDLLVLDMIMDPGIDGLETYERILKLHPGQKAIVASGFSETGRVKEMQRMGASQYLKKPYTLENVGLAAKGALAE